MSFESPRQKETENVEKKLYRLETGESIEVSAREFEYVPKGTQEVSDPSRENQSKQNVIFLPGWAMAADSKVVERLGKAFAEKSKGSAFSITTRAEQLPGTEDALYREALAIGKFIKEKGLSDVVIAGHSQGGDKAIDLITILQEDPELYVRGLVLLGSVGLYEQTPGVLAKNFVVDSMAKTPITLTKKLVSNPGAVAQGLRASNSIVSGIFKEIARSGTESVQRMKDEVSVMAQKNARLNQIRVPVILMSGAEDVVSNPNRIIPPGEEERMIEEWKRKDEAAGTETHIDPREKFLQENVFPESPYIRMLVPEKLGHHGLPLFRSESVANASLYLLKRFERREQQT